MSEHSDAHADDRLQRLVQQLDLTNGRATHRDVAASFGALAARLDLDNPHPSRARRSQQIRTGMLASLLGAVAAAVLAIVVIGRSPLRHVGYAQTTKYTTASGQIAHVTLADGSQVTLAPHTTIFVRRDMTRQREITLVGEAYFTVANGTTPFLVRAGGVTTRVLGTAFDVRHYPNETTIRILVTAGRVAVGPAVLSAGMRAQASDSSVVTTRGTDPATELAWTQGTLIFRDTEVRNAIVTLSRWYGVQLQLADSILATRHLNVTLTTTMSSADMLRTLNTLLHATATDDGVRDGMRIITLHAASPSLHAPTRRAVADTFNLLSERGR